MGGREMEGGGFATGRSMGSEILCRTLGGGGEHFRKRRDWQNKPGSYGEKKNLAPSFKERVEAVWGGEDKLYPS